MIAAVEGAAEIYTQTRHHGAALAVQVGYSTPAYRTLKGYIGYSIVYDIVYPCTYDHHPPRAVLVWRGLCVAVCAEW
jgi:hypothetical protein